MSAHVAPLLVEISTTPPSNAVAPAASNWKRWLNASDTGPAPAVSAGDIRLASDTRPESRPAQNPSSGAPALRLCAHSTSVPDCVHTDPPASNESIAELAGRSSVLSRKLTGTRTVVLQPLLVASSRLKSPDSAVATVSSSEMLNDTVVDPYAASAPTGTDGCAM